MDLLIAGYREYKDSFYYVPSPLGERLMIPGRYIEELKTAPVEKVDFVGTFIAMFDGKYTSVGSRDLMPPRAVRVLLNQNLPDVMPGVQDEVRASFQSCMPRCDDDWAEVPLVDTINYVVARASARMFGGEALSSNEEWIQTTLTFAVDVFTGARKVKSLPGFLKPVFGPFIKEVQAIKAHYRFAEKTIRPILDRRRETGEEAKDLLYWLDSQAEDAHRRTWFLSDIMLKLSFASLHTSAAACAQLIFDLCEHPEYVPLLREEYAAVIAADGRLGKACLAKMPLMDSVLRESQRRNPLLLVTFERIITEGWDFKDGFRIPKGTMIGYPAIAVAMDPEIYPDPDRFDGSRFARMRRENPNQQGKAQYVACNAEHMTFGYGRHACPGRFFAADEIKAIMVYLLENYDCKYKRGERRPQSLQFETQNIPDHRAKVLFKRRSA
ncbi:hypothetical protein DL765_006904 [Monosporascus sp. GIB2]|nr:hypothetical protein DL765_006904 [Monosporascus sp. GIB2]